MKGKTLTIIVFGIVLIGLIVYVNHPSRSTNTTDQVATTTTGTLEPQEYVRVYKGVLPCIDCEGIETTLSLASDGEFVDTGRFTLVETFVGTPDGLDGDLSIETVGMWTAERGTTLDPDAVIFVIVPDEQNGDKNRSYEILSSTTIRMLVNDSTQATSSQSYVLELQ